VAVGTGGCSAAGGVAVGGWAERRGLSERIFGAALTAVCLGATGVGGSAGGDVDCVG
jgi:hypothetical protein